MPNPHPNKMETALIDFNHWKGSQIGDTIQDGLNQLHTLQLINQLQPKFYREGNQWCYQYGELPNDCIVGFGDTPYLAACDFSKEYYTKKPGAVPESNVKLPDYMKHPDLPSLT